MARKSNGQFKKKAGTTRRKKTGRKRTAKKSTTARKAIATAKRDITKALKSLRRVK